MSEPLSIFSVKFLFFESTETPTEQLGLSILDRADPKLSTSVIVALYSRGFYIKGNLSHSSFEETKSRTDQFISSGLLREVLLYPFYKDLVVMIFHETITLITEVCLFSFSANLTEDCNRFFEYLQALLADRFCSMGVLSSLPKVPAKRLKGYDISELKVQMETDFNSQEASGTLFSPLDKFEGTTSEEILDSSYLSESSNEDVFNGNLQCQTQKPTEYPERIQKTHENIETFIETTVYKTKKFSLFNDEPQDTLDLLDSIETFCENDLDSSNSMTISRNWHNNSETFSNKSDDFRGSFYSISNQFDEMDVNEDNSAYSEEGLNNYFPMKKFLNESQNLSLLNSLNSIEEIELDSSAVWESGGNIFHQIFIPTDSGYGELSNSFKSGMKPNEDEEDDLFYKDSKPESAENKSFFCWPDFLKHESKLTSSLLVEMSILVNEMVNNWSLVDALMEQDSLFERKLPTLLEWDEKINRLNYDPKKKNFTLDDEGSLVIYCCRQVSVEQKNKD